MLKIRQLSPELQKKAIDELNEDPARIEKDLEAFREWIKKSPHIKGRTDDQFLVTFLRGCKYSLEKAKQKYDLFFTLKTHLAESFKNRDPMDKRNQELLNCGIMTLLPKASAPGTPRYFLGRPGFFDTDKFNDHDFLKIITYYFDTLLMEDDDFVISGIVFIGDASNVALKHLIIFNNPLNAKKHTMVTQDAYPVRQKATHILNMPSFMVAALNLMKSFLNEKNKARLTVHGNDLGELLNIVPKEILPKDYGGDAGTIEEIRKDNIKMIMSQRDFFLEDENCGVDEKKRVGKPKNPETLFGVDGTFRQLQID